jgi:large subunit ribosomal protein L5
MRLEEKYNKEIAPALKEKFGYKNIFAVPKLSKVVVNVGVGRHAKEKDYVDSVVHDIIRITGQKPVLTKAKKSISAFKIREGMIVGVTVTLRGKRMYDFVQKLVNLTFPRVRDFRGINTKIIDKQGNMAVGFNEHVCFPEIKADEVDNIHGVEICLHTTADSKESGLALFKLLGFPFIKE